MNIFSTLAEIGILDTLRVISRSNFRGEQIEANLPFVDRDYIENQIQWFADSIIKSAKTSLFLMLPEIALLERLSVCHWFGTVMLALPFDMDMESRDRVRANMPKGIKTEFINEGVFPSAFLPDNGAIICTGIVPNEYRQYLLPSCCRMMTLYKIFQGERIFLSCFPRNTQIPESGWTYSESDFFNRIIKEV